MGGWIDYWNRDDSMSGELWKAQSEFFVRQVSKAISFGPEDVLLDVGCGNGHVVALLAPGVGRAFGADTSERGVRAAAEAYASIPNLSFHALPPDRYLDLASLPARGVTRILCVSVLQYYKSLDEVRGLIAAAKSVAAPDCQMLLADLLIDYNLLKDIAGVLLGGLESGTFFAKLHEVVSGKHKCYAVTRTENPVLTFKKGDLERIAAAENVSLRFLPGNLTGNRFRAHALLTL